MSIVDTSLSSIFARGGRIYPKATVNGNLSVKEKAVKTWGGSANAGKQIEQLSSGVLVPENIAASSSHIGYANMASQVTTFARRRYM